MRCKCVNSQPQLMKAMTAVKCEGTCHNKRQYDDFDPLLNRALSEASWLLSNSNRTR